MPNQSKSPLLLTSGIGALGVVFGDIGTSPLYTFKTVLDLTGGTNPQTILGVVSLLVWTLIVVTTVKYAGFAMRIDNDGEGGILALMALLGVKRHRRPLIVAAGLFGAALIYGDGAITPAISVLSALEGLTLVEPTLEPYVLPLAILILFALFALQPLGTAKIGRAFGPIMALWFVVMAVLGISGIVRHPAILWALNPVHGITYLIHSGGTGFLVLGGVFLCVTGAEALYADMGHFGAKPIKFAWSMLVFPSLVLNYAGQGALVLAGASTSGNIFYRLCPGSLTLALVILSTVATVIASQSIITGAFSMTRQAIQLEWMPRMKIVQTSQAGYGQIYIGAVNWTLMIVTIGLALLFRKSDNLAGAYGIAVSATMLMTTVLLFIAMREIWGWNLAASGTVAALFFTFDTAFFTSNVLKLFDGGYVPLLLAALVYLVMYVWHRGVTAVAARLAEHPVSVDTFMHATDDTLARVPGTAAFLTRTKDGVPPVLLWYVRHSRALQRNVLAVTLDIASKPWVDPDNRIAIAEPLPGYWTVTATYGFMERADLPALMTQIATRHGCPVDPAALTYFIGRERVTSRDDGTGLPRWMASAFGLMLRNCTRVTDYLRVPADQVVDLGRQVSI
ncbi:potassium transporter Kup [Burkholderia sp. MSh2]|uniref:Probable potassium transport system protein Kup n=1 Tax=Burkholderia paludis TaxID=1506587 RepID=A0A6P2H403_9BURK|nr:MULTISPECIES: KUP/HAK/KT family potassium transporter [Burkholderia]KEZ01513.1 potassium transporter Kup [Burkholderia sp. MSh2]CAB3750553.1 Low affinity potassium transport system protein kup [Burkholderia paludis]VWB11748.1 potassium uptake protein [Burkholderia paludis]